MPKHVPPHLDSRRFPSAIRRRVAGGESVILSKRKKKPVRVEVKEIGLVAQHRVAKRSVEQLHVLQRKRKCLQRLHRRHHIRRAGDLLRKSAGDEKTREKKQPDNEAGNKS